MEDNLKTKIERWKIRAERFLKNKTPAFIIDVKNTYYFCNILELAEEGIYVKNFTGPRKFERDRIFWEDISKFDQYREEVVK